MSASVRWWATTATETRFAVLVLADTWYYAREVAAKKLGAEPGRVWVRRGAAKSDGLSR